MSSRSYSDSNAFQAIDAACFPKYLSLQEGLDKLQNTFDQHYSIGFCSCNSPKVEVLEDGTSVCSECTFDIKIN